MPRLRILSDIRSECRRKYEVEDMFSDKNKWLALRCATATRSEARRYALQCGTAAVNFLLADHSWQAAA